MPFRESVTAVVAWTDYQLSRTHLLGNPPDQRLVDGYGDPVLSNIDPLGLLAVAAVFLLLIVPTVIAYRRKVKLLWLVVVVNLAGITGVLWFVALYMAMTMRTRTADITPPNVWLDANGERPIDTHRAA